MPVFGEVWFYFKRGGKTGEFMIDLGSLLSGLLSSLVILGASTDDDGGLHDLKETLDDDALEELGVGGWI